MIDMNEQEELKNLLDAQKKINARIRQLKLRQSKKEFGTILLQRHPSNYNGYWANVHQIRIQKLSCNVESENGRNVTIIENNNMLKSLNYLKKVRKDIDKLIAYLESITVKDPNGSGREDK